MPEAAPDDPLFAWLDSQPSPDARPWVTLTFAQSLDGCLAAPDGRRLILSGQESLHLTHRLRAWHDCILVGIGTILADDPSLTVRHATGADPRPVILDAQLRLPLNARVLRAAKPPLIFAREDAAQQRVAQLRAVGGDVITAPAASNGNLDLRTVLGHLYDAGLRRLMVEGGGRVLQSMLTGRLGDCLVVTIAPRLVGGPGALTSDAQQGIPWPALLEPRWTQAGRDAILWARLEGQTP